MKLTPARKKALSVLKDKGPLTARAFAHAMWPDAPGHTKPSKCGNNGTSRGGGMVLAAGSFLSHLMRYLMVYKNYDSHMYGLTPVGEKALKESQCG